MKNFQKGSALVWVIVIIVVVLVVGGYFYVTSTTYVGSSNTSLNQTGQTKPSVQQTTVGQTTFNHPSGLYSFAYPSDWKFPAINVFSKITSTYYPLDVMLYSDTNSGDRLSIEVTKDQTLASNFEKAGHTGSSKNFIKQNVTVSGVNGYRMEYQDIVFGKGVDEVLYVLPLTSNSSSVVVYIGIDAWDSSWMSIAEPVAKSLKIDVSKTSSAVKQLGSNGGY